MSGLPDRNFVTMCELVTWLAYGKAVDAVTYLAQAQADAKVTNDLSALEVISADGHDVPEAEIATLRQRVTEIQERDSQMDVVGRAVMRMIDTDRLVPFHRQGNGTGVPQPFPDNYFLRRLSCDPLHDGFILDDSADMSEFVAWRAEPQIGGVVFRASEVLAINWSDEGLSNLVTKGTTVPTWENPNIPVEDRTAALMRATIDAGWNADQDTWFKRCGDILAPDDDTPPPGWSRKMFERVWAKLSTPQMRRTGPKPNFCPPLSPTA